MGESRMDNATYSIALQILLEVSLLEGYWILEIYGNRVEYWKARDAQCLPSDENFLIPFETSSS